MASGYRCPIRRSASSRIHRPYASTSAASPCARSQVVRVVATSGCTGGRPANRGGISIIALLISTATGFRSPARAVRPSRCASSGIVPPPANGSRIGGGPAGKHRSISARAAPSTSGSLEFSHFTSRSRIPNSRSPLRLLLLLGERVVPRRIVHQRSPEHRPSRRQRPPSPPQMQRRRMPVPDRLLSSSLRIDHRQRQRHLNQLRPVPGHSRSPYQPGASAKPGHTPRLAPQTTLGSLKACCDRPRTLTRPASEALLA